MQDEEFLTQGGEALPETTTELNNEPKDVEEGDEKCITWEANHKKIVKAINDAMRPYRSTPPGITELSRLTGLSRQTIYTHFKEYANHHAFVENTEMFKLMQFDVLMRLCSTALDGDMRAIKLYLQTIGMINQQGNLLKNLPKT